MALSLILALSTLIPAVIRRTEIRRPEEDNVTGSDEGSADKTVTAIWGSDTYSPDYVANLLNRIRGLEESVMELHDIRRSLEGQVASLTVMANTPRAPNAYEIDDFLRHREYQRSMMQADSQFASEYLRDGIPDSLNSPNPARIGMLGVSAHDSIRQQLYAQQQAQHVQNAQYSQQQIGNYNPFNSADVVERICHCIPARHEAFYGHAGRETGSVHGL